MKWFAVISCLGAALVMGCNGPAPPDQANSETGTMQQQTPPQAMPQETAREPSPEIPILRAGVEKAKENYEKSPKDPALARTYATALVVYGEAIQNDSAFARTKFKQALQMFRKAVKLDPKNERARMLIDMSESIYRDDLKRAIPPYEEPTLEPPALMKTEDAMQGKSSGG